MLNRIDFDGIDAKLNALHTLGTPYDAELGHGGGALLVLDADAPRLLVGYGPSLYEFAPPR